RRAVSTVYTSGHKEHNLDEPTQRRRNDMADALKLQVNARTWTIEARPDTPLLYVLTNDIGLNGPRFGCGLGQCGACSVLVDGGETRSWLTPTSRVVGQAVTTRRGLPAYYAARANVSPLPDLHPLQEAMIAEQAVQCGYCFNGQIIKGAELLFKTPQPTEAQIRSAMNGHICRCGTYPRIMSAIQRAAKAMASSKRSAASNEVEEVANV